MSVFHSNITTRLQTRSQNAYLNLLRPQKIIMEELILKYGEHKDKQNEYDKKYPYKMNEDLEYMKEEGIYVSEQQHIDRCNKISGEWKQITEFIEDLERCSCTIKRLLYNIEKKIVLETENLDLCNDWLRRINYDIKFLDDWVSDSGWFEDEEY